MSSFLKSLIGFTAIISVTAQSAVVGITPKQEVDVFVTSSLLKYTHPSLVKHKVNQYLNFEENFWASNQIAYNRSISSFEIIETDSRGVIQTFNELMYQFKKHGNETLKESVLNPNKYTVVISDVNQSEGVCAMSTTNRVSTMYSVIGFDLAGHCSGNHIFTHELGHQDGLVHIDEGDGQCLDGSRSLMSAGFDGRRNYLQGSVNCPSVEVNSSYKFYNSRIPLKANKDQLNTSTENGVYRYSLKNRELYISAKDIKGFAPRVDGTYFATFEILHPLLNGFHHVPLKRVKGGLMAELNSEQKVDLQNVKVIKGLVWVDD